MATLNLTSFMDETGHANDPTLHFAGMAGFVAPIGVWKVFEQHWNDLLAKAGVSEPFHMKDFAHSQGQFRSWKGNEQLRRILFGRLLEIIRETNADPVGAIVSVTYFKTLTPSQKSSFGHDPYFIAFPKCTRGAASSAVLEAADEKVDMVFAFQTEFGESAEKLWHAMKASNIHKISERNGRIRYQHASRTMCAASRRSIRL